MKEISIPIFSITTDVSELFKGYTKIHVESVHGNLLFLKDGLGFEDAIKIRDGEIYDVKGIVQIHCPIRRRAKSLFELKGFLE